MKTDIVKDQRLKGYYSGRWNLPDDIVMVLCWTTGDYKLVKCYDTFFDLFLGRTWESRLREAHRQVSREAEKTYRNKQNENYRIDREINPNK